MPEVINLVSSPIIRPDGEPRLLRKLITSATSKDLFGVDSDYFQFSDASNDLNFPSPQPTKRRKLSPATVRSASQAKSTYLLSDEEGLPSLDCGGLETDRVATAARGLSELLSDSIVFSSTPPALTKKVSFVVNVSDDLLETTNDHQEIVSFPHPVSTNISRINLSERTANLLATLGNGPSKPTSKFRGHLITNTRRGEIPTSRNATGSVLADDIFTSSPSSSMQIKTSIPAKPSDVRREHEGTDRAAAKAAKDIEKEAKKERKRVAKEEKAKEKQQAADFAEVNKSKVDKKASVTEMILDMSKGLRGTSVGVQVVEYMKRLDVETTFLEAEIDLLHDDVEESTGNTIKWRRKTKARYNEDFGQWEPLSVPKIEQESHLLVHLTAADFASLAVNRKSLTNQDDEIREDEMTKNIDIHVSSLRIKHQDCMPIYLIEGLGAWLRKKKNAKNRAYTSAVLSQISLDVHPVAPPSSSNVRRKKKPVSDQVHAIIDEDVAENLLLYLQTRHGILIHHTTSPATSAEWIKNFTEHISTIPYRQERMAMNDVGAAFCMDVGQVKTGDNPLDTYIKMLQEIQRVTPAMAYGISNHFPSVKELARAFKVHGPLVLEDVRKSANKDGGVTDTRLGQAVSKRLYKVFMGTNPASTDGIA